MKVTIRPVQDPSCEIDLTHRLVEVIAEEIWLEFGGNARLNWLEAEYHLRRLARTGIGPDHEAVADVLGPCDQGMLSRRG